MKRELSAAPGARICFGCWEVRGIREVLITRLPLLGDRVTHPAHRSLDDTARQDMESTRVTLRLLEGEPTDMA